VILLTGNGHARRDIACPRFLPPQQRGRIVSIALLESSAPGRRRAAGAYDAVFWTRYRAGEPMPVASSDCPCSLTPREGDLQEPRGSLYFGRENDVRR